MDKGHFTVENKPEYWGNSGGLEYEAAWALGSDTGVDDLDCLTYVNFLCNEDGMDPISFGATVAAAMELYETGAIDKETTGGIELRFGSAEALARVTELTARGEGFGLDLGLGSKRLCEKYGRPELSMTVKGQEFPAYDPRGIQGMGLTYATSNRGACHLRSYTVASEILGIPEKTDPARDRGQAGSREGISGCHRRGRFHRPVRLHHLCLDAREHRAPDRRRLRWRVDGGASRRSGRARLEPGARLQQPGRDSGRATTRCPGVSWRRAPTSVPAEGKTSGLTEMLPEYYELRGWAPDGTLTTQTRDRFGLPG